MAACRYGDGNRANTVQVAGATTTTTYTPSDPSASSGQALYEKVVVTGGATTTRSYYYAGTTRIAVRENGTLRFLATDHLGSTSLILSSQGAVVARQRFCPFGGQRTVSTTEPNTYTAYDFTGQRLDGTGLHFYNARYYSSAVGRFVSADTLVPDWTVPQDLNRYSYTRNNPLRYTDPTGHCLEPATALACIAGALSLAGITLAISQIPGDTVTHGQSGDPVVMAIGLAAASEPLDWLLTMADCAANGCDPVTAQQALLPGPNPALVSKLDDAAPASQVDSTLALPKPSGVNPRTGNIVSSVTEEETVVYRVWGGKAREQGAWTTPTRPASAVEARNGLALPRENTAEFVSEVHIPAGTRIQTSIAAKAFGRPGRWIQIELLEPIPPSAFRSPHRLPLGLLPRPE